MTKRSGTEEGRAEICSQPGAVWWLELPTWLWKHGKHFLCSPSMLGRGTIPSQLPTWVDFSHSSSVWLYLQMLQCKEWRETSVTGANWHPTNKKQRNPRKNVNKSHGIHLQPHHFQATAHTLQWWFESNYTARKHWEQSGEGAEPIPWSPIIRCARPWRETRAKSAINKGAWEGVVTVTRISSDRHRASYETCLYHRGKPKMFFQPLLGMFWAKGL